MPKWLKRTLYILLVLAVTITALGLRFRAAALLPIDYDEDDYLSAGQHYAAVLRSGELAELSRYQYNYEHPPLAKLAYGLVLSFLPEAKQVNPPPVSAPPASSLPQPQFKAARFTAVALSTLEVLALAVINPMAGLFLGIHTFTIKYTSQVMLESLPALLSLLVVIVYTKSKRRWNFWLVLSAALLGMTVASKYLYVVAGIAVAIHWSIDLIRSENRFRWKEFLPMLAWGAFALIFFYVFDPFLWPDPFGRLIQSLQYNITYSQSSAVTSAGFPFYQPFVWLTENVPWHPGVFLIGLDVLIALLAIIGFVPLWKKKRVFALWLLVGILFLLFWRTKWPQYILILTAPLALAAAEGLRVVLWEPLRTFFHWLRAPKTKKSPQEREFARRELRKAMPWLIPGLAALLLLAIFPLVFQLAMSLTDFSGMAIRDGMRGGIWREIWLGLTGQVSPASYYAFSGPVRSDQVHYAGLSLLSSLLESISGNVVVFEVLWTVLCVTAQTALGVGLALLLHRRGVLLKGFWRSLFIIPWAIPEFVGALSWSQIFDPTFGWLATASRTWSTTPGFTPPAISTQDPNFMLVALLVAGLWYGFPLMFLAASAGLKALPAEVYDAAAIDGASSWQVLRHITWPMLLPLLAPAIILRAIFAFNQFYLFVIMEARFPMLTLSAISYYFFNTGGGSQYALSAAINVVTVIFLLLLILGFNRYSKAAEGVTYA